MGLVFVFDLLFSFLAMPVVAWFSRLREYRADSGGARLAGREKMISALQALKRTYNITEQVPVQSSVRAFQISSKMGWMEIISTHPNLDKRIAALSR
jgi:heat shock protein HtpX